MRKKNSIKPEVPEAEPKLTIEVSKYSSLVNALSGRNWWRFMLMVLAIGMLLFLGISILALAIKRMYPYSDITTNGLGATTIKSEKNEVSYWLFNTASFWESSGISVKEGDIITVRTSGKFNTAMHHLYDATKYNTNLKDKWMDSAGMEDNSDVQSGGYFRRKYRIFPSMPSGALIMQVSNNKPNDTPVDANSEENFYFIGKERQNIHIKHSGTLYFCVNDIVLNRRIISEMIYESIKETTRYKEKAHADSAYKNRVEKSYYKSYYTNRSKELFSYYEAVFKEDFDFASKKEEEKTEMIRKLEDLFGKQMESRLLDNQVENEKQLKDTLFPLADTLIPLADKKDSLVHRRKYEGKVLPDRIIQKVDKVLSFYGDNPKDGKEERMIFKPEKYKEAVKELMDEVESGRSLGKMKLGVSKDKKTGKVISELQYYLDNDYKTAWFDDNLGSWLVIIEKDAHK